MVGISTVWLVTICGSVSSKFILKKMMYMNIIELFTISFTYGKDLTETGQSSYTYHIINKK